MAEVGWRERRIEVQGRPLFVRMGPAVPGSIPLVHVHGFAVSGRYLLPTARALASRGTTVVPDLPGYGQSPAWGHALRIPSLAWALLEVLDVLGLERVYLIGNSMGGPVSLEVAHSDYLHFGPVNGLSLFSELTRFPSRERLLGTPVPTLAVIGSRDPLMPSMALIRGLGRLAPPHLTVVMIDGAAHAINFSHPDELAHVIKCWLDGSDITGDPSHSGSARVLRIRPGDG